MPRALVADDEPNIARAVAMMIARSYEVDVANGLAEGTQLVHRVGYDLVLTDLRMEHDDSGVRLLALVAEVQPHAVRVLITGGEPPAQHAAHAVLRKPFDLEELERAIASQPRAVASGSGRGS